MPSDLAANLPGASLQGQITAALAAVPPPSLLRRILLGKRAWRHAPSTWELGAVGERLVAAELQRLCQRDPRWRVLHSIPVGTNGSDIDHVIIGPAGVFTLNTKHHAGKSLWVAGNTFMVNGQRQHHIRNARFEASRASKLLTAAMGAPVMVRGFVVPVNAKKLVVKEAPEDVTIVNRAALCRHLRSLPPVLDQSAVEALYARARLLTTWVQPVKGADGDAAPEGPPRDGAAVRASLP